MYAKKNSGRRVIALLVALMLVIGGVIGGTLAWLMTKTDPLENTFVAGEIGLKLEEPSFPDTKTLKFLPGDSFAKDPTVTVEAGSAPCYVRAFMVIWWDKTADPLFNAEDGKDWFYAYTADPSDNYLPYSWVLTEELYDNTGDPDGDGEPNVLGIFMEYRWNGVVDASETDQVLYPLFGGINVPAELSTEQYLSLDNFKLTLLAQAVQAEGVPDLDEDGDVDADDAFAAAGIPDVTLEHCNNQTLAVIIENLRDQDITNDREESQQNNGVT